MDNPDTLATIIDYLDKLYIINGSILILCILDFTFKWCIKPLHDWISSLFSEEAC